MEKGVQLFKVCIWVCVYYFKGKEGAESSK